MRKMAWIAASALVLACGPCCTYKVSSASDDRADCPGKIICPITGEEICKDQCPLTDPDRPNCPGRIECPLTGELVCRDRCPLGPVSATQGDAPSFCRGTKRR